MGESISIACDLRIESVNALDYGYLVFFSLNGNAALAELRRKIEYRHLSGGQKQRLAAAAAMVCGKALLVFDEPTSGLDYDSMTRLAALIRHLTKMGKVILVVTHDYEFACRACTRVLHLDGGTLRDDLPVAEETVPRLRDIFNVR